MHKVIVVGDRDSIYGFSCGGFETCFVTQSDDIALKVRQLAQEDYAAIYIVESLYPKIQPVLAEYEEKLSPAIIPIPGIKGNTGVGFSNITKLVEQAIGSDILFGGGSRHNTIPEEN